MPPGALRWALRGALVLEPPERAAPLLRRWWGVWRSIPVQVKRREGLLAALPFLLSLGLITISILPAFRALNVTGSMYGFYAYQGLVQDIQAHQVVLLTPGVSAQQRQESLERVLSSTRTPEQFKVLGQVETFGEARLSHIDQLVSRNTPASLAAAGREAIMLNAQTASYMTEVNRRNVRTLHLMRLALLFTAALTGLLSMALVGRALLLWRAEGERQERREARQRQALSLASHELRRPLQQLLLASDLLRQAEGETERQQMLLRIEESAAQIASRADLSRLNDLYLDVSLRLRHGDLKPILQAVSAGNARVRLHLPADAVPWSVDPDRFRQMIENLLENALKYTFGPVDLNLHWHGAQPQICVRDYGEGISPALMQRVFLPYERGPRGLVQGQGLGLSLVRRYAHAHGGEVTLSHAASGPGTLACLTLGQPQDASVTTILSP